ncbi:inositol monophosphatase family protein [Ornithinimicrobium pratense]|uniref:Inositol-1-monophosphatase n=1 Tax=Ornithinimicrobium pratense TaxID=2593973 RepID=A0A5J6V329_9MICO|nr:inositol monophosphatase family protein [Ornithinimicrobium pratense]QFG68330.1 inositol monophosphatase [Ornithinimicrobium pratense]
MTPPAPDPGAVPEEERAELEELAVQLALEAGVLIRDERPRSLGVDRVKSSELDVVTVMDTRSEQLLRDRIATARPDDAILGEEEGLSTGTSGLSWVLDPIDGTVNYLYNLPAYAVSVAVVVGDPMVAGAWAPVAGAVINPRTDEVFHARVGGGAHLLTVEDSVPIRVGQVADLGGALLATGFAYDRQVRRGQAETLAALLPHVRDIRRMGAAALDLCHVAAGRVDGYWEQGVRVWDVAAGMLVVTEAGGVVSGASVTSPPSSDLTVAAGPALHPVLLEALAGSALG